MPNAKLSFGVVNTFTDQKGNFLFEHIPPGIGKIRVETTRFHNYEQDILIEAGENRKGLSIFLTEVTGTIEGIIKDETGKALAEAEVSGIFRLAKPPATTKTDDKGHYIFTEIPRGSYHVRANAQGCAIDGAIVNVNGGSPALINFTLRPGNLAISGEVLTKQGRAPLDSEIYLMRNGVVVARSNKFGHGRFIFNNLVSDIYEIEVLSPGYVSRGWRGKLEKSETLDFELEAESTTSCSP